MYFLTEQQQEQIKGLFKSAGNYISYSPGREACLTKFYDLIGHASKKEVESATLLFYYHHRNRTKDIYTVHCLFYDAFMDIFVTYTLYEHDCRRQTARPELSAFKSDVYTSAAFLAKLMDESNGSRFLYPNHHSDSYSSGAFRELALQILAVAYDEEFEQCEL